MIKTTDTKTSARSVSKNNRQPFFNKESEPSFFSSEENKADEPFFVQTKLSIGQPNDKYEQEADRMADKVVQRLNDSKTDVACKNDSIIQAKSATPVNSIITSLPGVQAKCAGCEQGEKVEKKEEVEEKDLQNDKLQKKPVFESNAEPPDDEKNIQRKCAECEEEEDKNIQLKSNNESSQSAIPSIESNLSGSIGGGAPLPENTRTQMESSFGADFSNVRVHNDDTSAQMNKDLNAQAFTHDNDIYFNTGKYDTNSKAGQHLIAHELTHTIQQTAGKGNSSNLKNEASPLPEKRSVENSTLPSNATDFVGIEKNNATNTQQPDLKFNDDLVKNEPIDSKQDGDINANQIPSEKQLTGGDVKHEGQGVSAYSGDEKNDHEPLGSVDDKEKTNTTKGPNSQDDNLGKNGLSREPDSGLDAIVKNTGIQGSFLPENPTLLQTAQQIIDGANAEKEIFRQNILVRKKAVIDNGEKKANDISSATLTKVGEVGINFQQARLNVQQRFSVAITRLLSQANIKKIMARTDSLLAIASLSKETANKKKASIDAAGSKAKEIELFGQSEAKRASKTSNDSITRINNIAKQTLGKHGSTPEGKAAADKAVLEMARSVITQLRNNGSETASGAVQTANEAAGKLRDAGNQFAGELGKSEASISQNIQQTTLTIINEIEKASQKNKENLIKGKTIALSSLQSAKEEMISGLRKDGKQAAATMRNLGYYSADQLELSAAKGLKQLNHNVSEIIEHLNWADSHGKRLNDETAQSSQEMMKGTIRNGRLALDSTTDEQVLNAQSQSENLSLQSIDHINVVSRKSFVANDQFVNRIAGDLSKAYNEANKQFEQIRTEGNNINQQSIQKYGQSLQEQIDSEKQKWDGGKKKTENDIKSKVDEGLRSHFEAEAHAAADFSTAAKKAASDEESSTALKIIKGIASAVWSFIKGLALFVLLVAIVAVALFLIVAYAFGIFFAILAIGAILEIALIVVAIGLIVYALIDRFIIRLEQLLDQLSKAGAIGNIPWYEAFALGVGVFFIAAGDVIGITPIIEGIAGEEAITGKKLSTEERAERITAGILQLATLFLGEALRKLGGKKGVPEVPEDAPPKPKEAPVEEPEPKKVPKKEPKPKEEPKILPKDPYNEIAKYREDKNFDPYDLDDPNTGTVARGELNGQVEYGRNSKLGDPEIELRKEGFDLVKDQYPKAKVWSQVNYLTHAEALVLLRLRKIGALAEEMTIFVDRPTCNMCLGGLPKLLKVLGIKKLTIYSGGRSTPITIP